MAGTTWMVWVLHGHIKWGSIFEKRNAIISGGHGNQGEATGGEDKDFVQRADRGRGGRGRRALGGPLRGAGGCRRGPGTGGRLGHGRCGSGSRGVGLHARSSR